MPTDLSMCYFCHKKGPFKSVKALNTHFQSCGPYQEIWKKQDQQSPEASPKRALGPLPPEQRKRGRFDEQERRDDDHGEGPSHPQQSGPSADDIEPAQLVGHTFLHSKMFLIRYRIKTTPPLAKASHLRHPYVLHTLAVQYEFLDA
jgi:hypothetical protein